MTSGPLGFAQAIDEVYLAEDPRTLGPVALGSDDYAAWGASAAR